MIFAIDSAKNAKDARVVIAGYAPMRMSHARCRTGNGSRINTMRAPRRGRAMPHAKAGFEAHDALRVRRDIDMHKTSLDRPDPDGFMPSLFSND
ncbi:hypothetical protein L0Y88_25415 [Burkholderia multivorans]|uniref:hypothetical protein n=1 Tax=Burkholderia multivorans TaxID=87883 RepID=UPI002019CB9D|nr:hypothetical protein [Burkholderia multivorans]MCL4658637.1 hypothetical protein [Burkholderia multivorans]MCO1424560.1 hypothetical protein [Burkholderia multivorans]UQN54881.1 hypothetical protein L0Y88_25415 [Burkholderia multivorans]UQN80193.1 hypothetical protein L0Z18_11345 [Burkholderia multivorans]